MPVLVLARHAQSESNSTGMLTGTLNPDLTEKGKMQAGALGRALKDYSFKLVYTSDKLRAVHTADLIMQEGAFGDIPRLATPALGPRSYGDLEGRRSEELKLQYGPDELLQFRRGWDTAPPNGDSFKAVVERVNHFWEQYLVPHLYIGPDQMQRSDILVVSHGNVLAALMVIIEGLKPQDALRLQPSHSVFTEYRFEVNYNQQTHESSIQLLNLTDIKINEIYYQQMESISIAQTV